MFVKKKLKELEEKKIREDNMGKKFIAEQTLDYEPVNKKSFSMWLAKFTAERELIKAEEYKKRSKQQIERDTRISGKAYFLDKQGLAGSNINFEEDEIDKIIEEQGDDDEEIKDENVGEGEEMGKYFDQELFDDEDLDDIDLD